MVNNSNKDFGKLLRKHGYAMPLSDDEVIAFENKYKKDFESPNEWSSIEDIIGNKDSLDSSKVIVLEHKNNESISSLSMAAREGKRITDEIRNKMIKDKKNAKK